LPPQGSIRPSTILPVEIMKIGSVRWLAAVLTLVIGVAACSEISAPATIEQVPDGELPILPVSADAPPLIQTEVTFWAVRGEERVVEMSYDASYGGNGNGKCLLFRVPATSLLKHPDGRDVAMGDSIQITIRALNASQFLFEFEPAGLRFSPVAPARLEVRYKWADVNGDGVANEADGGRLALYRQERPGMVWEKIPSTQRSDIQEIRAAITGFTLYALATE
jgi:hypothetical protein